MLKKIFEHDSKSFLKMEIRRFFVFEQYIVFKNIKGIFAVNHSGKSKKHGINAVDLFEQEYSWLGLSYEFIGNLASQDIKRIRKRLKKLKK